MESIKQFDVHIFIGIFHVCAYILGYLNVTADFLFGNWNSAKEENENADLKESMYSNYYKILSLVFTLIMTIASIILIRGVFKKSVPLIASWIILSLCMLLYIAQFLFNQFIFWICFGNTQEPLDMILGLFLIFGIEILCIRRVFGFCKTLFIQDLQHKENPLMGSKNYHKNLTQDDHSILTPLNLDEEFEKHYVNSSQVNLTKFQI